jgi:hypothetical protein
MSDPLPRVSMRKGGRMPKAYLWISDEQLATSRYELLEIVRGDPTTCAFLRHDGQLYLVLNPRHAPLYLMSERGDVYRAEYDDGGWIAFQEPEPEGCSHPVHAHEMSHKPLSPEHRAKVSAGVRAANAARRNALNGGILRRINSNAR